MVLAADTSVDWVKYVTWHLALFFHLFDENILPALGGFSAAQLAAVLDYMLRTTGSPSIIVLY